MVISRGNQTMPKKKGYRQIKVEGGRYNSVTDKLLLIACVMN
jgi:hypothetical protein